LTDGTLTASPAIAVAPDDSIYLAGGTGSGNFALVKYLPDGENLDDSFGTEGVASGPFSEASAVAVEPGGRIIVAGVDTTSADEWAIAGFEADGTPDANFAPNGELDGQVAGDPAAMALQPDGNILVVGDSIDPTSGDQTATIARYNSGLAVQVADLEPTIVSAGVTATGGSYSTGEETMLTGSFTDPVSGASRTVTIDWGDGTDGDPDTTTLTLNPGQTTFSTRAQQYAASGQYIITVSVGDAAGSSAPVTVPVTYTDLAPTQIVLDMSDQVVIDDAAELSGSFTDPDPSQSHLVTIDWGDGPDGEPDPTTVYLSPGVTGIPAEYHTYTGDGRYDVSVTVANSLGSAQQRATVDVLDTTPTTDLSIGSFTVDTSGNLSVAYTVGGAAATPFTIGVYSSPDGVQLGNMVQSVDVSAPALLAVGTHTVTFAVQSGALSAGGYYVADLDVYDEVAETSRAGNESAPLAGVFQAGDGSVYVFTPSGGTNDAVAVANGSTSGTLDVTVDSTLYAFQNVSYIYATTYGTGDTVSVDPQVQAPFSISDGANQDVRVGFYLSSPTARTELDIQAAIDAVYGGTGGVTLQLQAVQGAGLMEVWDSPEDGNQIAIGTGGVIENWGFSSTGEVGQSVWISQQGGASDGEAEVELAFAGNPSRAALKALSGGTRPQANAFHLLPTTFIPRGEDSKVSKINGGLGADIILTRKNTINPKDVNPIGAYFTMTFPASVPRQALQHVEDDGTLWLDLAGGGGSGGGDNSPASLDVTWKESYYEMWSTYNGLQTQLDKHAAGPKTPAEYLQKAYGVQIKRDGNKLMAYFTKTRKSYEITSWEYVSQVNFTITNETANFVLPQRQPSNIQNAQVPYAIFYGAHTMTRTPDAKTPIMAWYFDPGRGMSAKLMDGYVDLSDPKNFVNVGTTLDCWEVRTAAWSADQPNPTTVELTCETTGYR
jgi:hypothetical protein